MLDSAVQDRALQAPSESRPRIPRYESLNLYPGHCIQIQAWSLHNCSRRKGVIEGELWLVFSNRHAAFNCSALVWNWRSFEYSIRLAKDILIFYPIQNRQGTLVAEAILIFKITAEKTWKVLEDAVHEINNHNASGLSFEELYR